MNSTKEKQELARRVRRLVNAIKKKPSKSIWAILEYIKECEDSNGAMGTLKVFSTTLHNYCNKMLDEQDRLEVARELTKNYL